MLAPAPFPEIVEETPSTAVSDELGSGWRGGGRVARHMGYQSAGTIECLVLTASSFLG